MGSDELHIDLMSQIQLPPRWRKPQKHSCKKRGLSGFDL